MNDLLTFPKVRPGMPTNLLGVTIFISYLGVSALCRGDVFDVYITAGQSNMDGRGYNNQLIGGLASYAVPQPDVLFNYTKPSSGESGSSVYQTGWVSLAPGYSVPPGFSGPLPSPSFGPEVSFGHATRDGTTGRRVAIIKVSRGGTNLASDWDPSHTLDDPKGHMYRGFETAVPQAIQALQAMGHSVEIRGMIWHQGESDGSGSSAATQAAYETNLTEFIQSVRTDLGYAHLPFIIGELESVDGGREAVRAAQASVAAAMEFVEFVPSAGLTVADGTHFTTDSVIELGNHFAQSMLTSISTLQGDFNRDGLVDNDDFLFWGNSLGSTLDARADANNDGIVDEADYLLWHDSPYRVLPELPSQNLAAIGAFFCGSLFRSQRRRTRQLVSSLRRSPHV